VKIYSPIAAQDIFDPLVETNAFYLEIRYPGEDWQEYEDEDGRYWREICDEDYEDEIDANIAAAKPPGWDEGYYICGHIGHTSEGPCQSCEHGWGDPKPAAV